MSTKATIIVQKQKLHYRVVNRDASTVIADGFAMKHDAEVYAKFIRDQQPADSATG